MIKIKPSVIPVMKKVNKQPIQKEIQKDLDKTSKIKLDISGEEEGYFIVNGKVVNIIFTR